MWPKISVTLLQYVYFLAETSVLRYASSMSFWRLGSTGWWFYMTLISLGLSESKGGRTLYSMVNSPYFTYDVRLGFSSPHDPRLPFPWVAPRSWLEYPNMSLRATSAVTVNSSSRTSLSTMVPRRVFRLPMTAPASCESWIHGWRRNMYFEIRMAPRPQLSWSVPTLLVSLVYTLPEKRQW